MSVFELKAAASGAVLPWRSDDKPFSKEQLSDLTLAPQWEIDACLDCPFPECHDCFYAWKNAMGNIRNDTHKSAKKQAKKRRAARA